MNPKFSQFIAKADVMVINPFQRVAVLTSSLALALSNIQHLPTTVVENPINYFNMNIMPGINGIISEWNENMVIDVKNVIDQVRAFWLVRYTAAYPLNRLIYSSSGGFFSGIMGVSTYVSPSLLEFLDGECKMAILTLSNEALSILPIN